MYTYTEYSGRIEKKLFINPDGLHGVLHSKRVMLLVLFLAEQLKCTEQDIHLLAMAAAYHDIGRRHDGICEVHGMLSIRKATKLGLINHFNGEDLEILKYIIIYHCMDDQTGLDEISSMKIFNQERAKALLKILKDADNLDRVRLGDLDTKFLRHDISKGIVKLAEELLKLDDKLDQVMTGFESV